MTKLREEKTKLSTELAEMKRNVNKIMLSGKAANVKSEDAMLPESAAERLRLGERMIATMENSKRSTSLLGSQLQEIYVRNEKLS